MAAEDRPLSERLAENPFYVLGLRPGATRAEVEREGQKLLGMLELKLAGTGRYRSPLGEHERTPEKVREAMAELRDPERRLRHELWARPELAAEAGAPAEASPPAEAAPAWTQARAALGWGRT
jgi:hypothetical protein